MNSHEVFIHIHQGCFAGTRAIVRLPQCQWSKHGGYGKISQCITTTKHSKAKTVCIFLGIYCMFGVPLWWRSLIKISSSLSSWDGRSQSRYLIYQWWKWPLARWFLFSNSLEVLTDITVVWYGRLESQSNWAVCPSALSGWQQRKKTLLRITGLREGNPLVPGISPHQEPMMRKELPCLIMLHIIRNMCLAHTELLNSFFVVFVFVWYKSVFFTLNSLALVQSYDCLCTSEATLQNSCRSHVSNKISRWHVSNTNTWYINNKMEDDKRVYIYHGRNGIFPSQINDTAATVRSTGKDETRLLLKTERRHINGPVGLA